VCPGRQPAEAEEAMAAVHLVVLGSGKPSERVRGIEGSGAKVVVVLTWRVGIRVSEDDGCHGAWSAAMANTGSRARESARGRGKGAA
jgi:hypothetical protein